VNKFFKLYIKIIISVDFIEKEARARFTGTEIILYNLDKLNINVFERKNVGGF